MRKQGFTLLELLVVIAVMTALMGLLMPAISKMKTNAKEQRYEIQKRAIASAVAAYRLRYHQWPGKVVDMEAGQDETYGGGLDGNNVVFDRLEFPPDGDENDSDESVIDMGDFPRRDSDDNVIGAYGDPFEITLDLDEDYTPSGGVSIN